MLFDIVSDLHVEHWEHARYDWRAQKRSDNVIIAGDVADNLLTTVQELKTACDVYERVLYLSGNHEATHYYDRLERVGPTISYMMENRPNFTNLDLNDAVFEQERLAVVGKTGWWDFRSGEPTVSFDDAVANFETSSWCPYMNKQDVVCSIYNEARRNYNSVRKSVTEYKALDFEICLVTHTVPHRKLMSVRYPADPRSAAYYGNSMFETFFEMNGVNYAVFGHCHDSITCTVNSTFCVNNARGRPRDFNRNVYEPYILSMGKKIKSE